MSLSTLTAEEATVLLGMLREVVQADGEYSAEEAAEMAQIKEALGDERFEAAVEAARTTFTSRRVLAEWVPKVTRPEARDVILDTLSAVAASDDIAPGEDEPIQWLAKAWGR